MNRTSSSTNTLMAIPLMQILNKASNHAASLIASSRYEQATELLQAALTRTPSTVNLPTTMSASTDSTVIIPIPPSDTKDPKALAWPLLVLLPTNDDGLEQHGALVLSYAAAFYNLGLACHRQSESDCANDCSTQSMLLQRAQDCYQEAYRIAYASDYDNAQLLLAICQNLICLAMVTNDEDGIDFWSHQWTQFQVRQQDANLGCAQAFLYNGAAPAA